MQWGRGGRSREALLLVALLEQAGIRRIWYRERHGVCVGEAGVCTVVSLEIFDFAKTRSSKRLGKSWHFEQTPHFTPPILPQAKKQDPLLKYPREEGKHDRRSSSDKQIFIGIYNLVFHFPLYQG